ncbi:hypothetical protein BSF38_01600 [Paludisphaera borealis]|uniref:Uncharacterized protein n=1 Tax=Paludisphaera borealis TaxID=1387353 RepID=A0A1U7CMJ5_9BACT|nr:hypothetical protein BSF38_01600 [Paludisphaera borealis]
MTSNEPSPSMDPSRESTSAESATSVKGDGRTRFQAPANPIRWAILTAFVVGIVAGGIGETEAVKFKPALTTISIPGSTYQGPSSNTRRAAQIKEVALRSALLGGMLGLGVGLAGGFARRSGLTAILGATIGLIVGGGLGSAVAWPVLSLYLDAEDAGPGELLRSVLMHLGLWLPIGVAAGLALGLGEPRRIPAAVLGGLVGVALATIAYEILGSIVYPLAETGGPVALEWQPRLLATLLVAVGAAGGAAALVRSSK